jgi:hypothetical protein
LSRSVSIGRCETEDVLTDALGTRAHPHANAPIHIARARMARSAWIPVEVWNSRA